MIIESNIRALVLLNLFNSLRKRDEMLGKPRISSLFPNLLNNITSIKHEHSCKILYLFIVCCCSHCGWGFYAGSYTTLANFSMNYLVMCEVYTDVGGIK